MTTAARQEHVTTLLEIILKYFDAFIKEEPQTTVQRYVQIPTATILLHRTQNEFYHLHLSDSYAEGGATGVGPKQASQLRDLKLNDGNEIPMVARLVSYGYMGECSDSRQLGYGLGTARAKSDASAPLDNELVKTVVMAIKAGFFHIDGAQGRLRYAHYHPILTSVFSLW